MNSSGSFNLPAILPIASTDISVTHTYRLYELNPNWHSLPSFCLVLPFRGDHLSVVNYSDMQKESPNVHMPPINPTGVVHASQSFQILKEIPNSADSKDGWKAIKRMTSLKDTGKGLIIGGTTTIVDGKGTEYVRMEVGLSITHLIRDTALTSFRLLHLFPLPPHSFHSLSPLRMPSVISQSMMDSSKVSPRTLVLNLP